MRFPWSVLQGDYERWQTWMAENVGQKNQDWSIDVERYEEKNALGRVWAHGASPFIVINDEKKAFMYALYWSR